MISRLMDDFMPLMRLQDEMNRAFESFFEDAPRRYSGSYPAINVWEEPDGSVAHIEAELPGMTIGNLDVSVLGNEVTISGERRIGQEGDAARDVTWHRRERGVGKFSRTLTLPWEIDADHVEARLHDGVLDVKLPKAESSRPKKVKLLTS